MNLSMRSKFFSFIALLAVAAVHAEDVDLEKAVGSVIASEKAYAKLAADKGFREASISVFADDAVIFAPSAVNGKKFWREAKKDPVISWRPSFASISRSGEVGYTTGPWESRKAGDVQKPDAFGHFVTIWQKNRDNVWKVALDVGLDHPQPQGVETEISTYVPNAAIRHSESASADLEKAQRNFAESLKEDETERSRTTPPTTFAFIAMANSRSWARELPKNYCPNRMQKRRARHEARVQVTRLISCMNMVNSQASATMLPSTVSMFASGGLSPMAPAKSRSIFKRAHRQRNRNTLLSFRA